MRKRGRIVLFLFALTVSVALLPIDSVRAQSGCPTSPSCVGFFGQPFEEPTIQGIATNEKCIEINGRLECKPAAGSMAILRNGKILYFNALEGSENVEFSFHLEFGQKSVNSQTRVLTLGANDAPSWTRPDPVDGGATNDDPETLTGGLLDNDDPGDANNGDVFCAHLVQMADGRIIVTGGTDYYSEPGIDPLPYGVVELEGLKNTRIYNPWDNRWTQTGSMNYGRWYPTMTSLANSDIVVSSGVTKLVKPVYPDNPRQSGRNVVQTETYHVDCGTWTGNGPLAERTMPLFPRMHLLPNGHVLYAAGGQSYDPDGQAYDQALWNIESAYNPQTKTWTDIAYAGFPLQLNQVGLGQLVTGLNITNPTQVLLLTSALLGQTFSNPTALATQLSGLVGSTISPNAVEQIVGSGMRGTTFSIMLPLKADSNGNYNKAEILTAGGVVTAGVLTSPGTYFGTTLSRIDSYTVAGDNISVQARSTGMLNNRRWFSTATVLADGSVMTFSGADNDEVVVPGLERPVQQAERFDPATETWQPMATANRARTYHNTAALLPDGRVLVGGHAPITTAYLRNATLPGGFAPNNGRDPSFEIYTPPYALRTDRPTITLAPDTVSNGQTFTISTPNASAITKVLLIRYTAITHLVDADQRTVELKITSRTSDSLTVKTPPAAVAPAGAYMLFINKNSTDGPVPSVSRRVLITRGGPVPCQ